MNFSTVGHIDYTGCLDQGTYTIQIHSCNIIQGRCDVENMCFNIAAGI